MRAVEASVTPADQCPAHPPLDEQDDIYDALSVREGPWFMQGEDGELLPISREQIAQALAWRRRLAERD